MSEPRDVDDLASALLDGLLTGEEADAARHDPVVARRVDEMRAARSALRQVPPGDAARRGAALAAALDARDPFGLDPDVLDSAEPGAGHADSRWDGAASPPPPPRPPAAGSASRRRAWRDPRWLATAAAVVLVAAVGGAVASSSSSDDDDAATMSAADETSRAGSGAGRADGGETGQQGGGEEGADASAESAPGSTGSGGEALADADAATPGAASAPTDAGPPVVDLGTVGSVDELASRAREASLSRQATPVAPDEEALEALVAGPCPDPREGTGDTVLHGRAQLDGSPVEVWVHDDSDGSQRLVVTDASCAVVADRPLD